MQKTSRVLWLRWVAANALSEFVGLGATFLVIGLSTSRIASSGTVASALLTLLIAVCAGAIEASVVGLAQWWAMHPYLSTITRSSWWRATLAGVLLGYVLGYMPSTLMDMSQTAGQQPAAEPPQWVVLVAAAGLGVVAGAVLSFFQWRVLRLRVERAGLWVPANMLAWALGMPIIFWVMDAAFNRGVMWQSALIVAAGLLVTGAVVGAVHGRVLVVLVEGAKSSSS